MLYTFICQIGKTIVQCNNEFLYTGFKNRIEMSKSFVFSVQSFVRTQKRIPQKKISLDNIPIFNRSEFHSK